MPICIECRYPVPQLYHVLHSTAKPSTTPAPTPSSTLHQKSTSNGSQILATAAASVANINEGTRGGGEAAKKGSSGSDVRLTQCPRCKRFADKYVEHDFVVLFIDLVLVKPQVRAFSLLSPLSFYFHVLTSILGLQTPPLQPPGPRRRRIRSLHHPARDSAPPFRRVPHMVQHRGLTNRTDSVLAHPTPTHPNPIPLLLTPLPLYDPRSTPHHPLSCAAANI